MVVKLFTDASLYISDFPRPWSTSSFPCKYFYPALPHREYRVQLLVIYILYIYQFLHTHSAGHQGHNLFGASHGESGWRDVQLNRNDDENIFDFDHIQDVLRPAKVSYSYTRRPSTNKIRTSQSSPCTSPTSQSLEVRNLSSALPPFLSVKFQTCQTGLAPTDGHRKPEHHQSLLGTGRPRTAHFTSASQALPSAETAAHWTSVMR